MGRKTDMRTAPMYRRPASIPEWIGDNMSDLLYFLFSLVDNLFGGVSDLYC